MISYSKSDLNKSVRMQLLHNEKYLTPFPNPYLIPNSIIPTEFSGKLPERKPVKDFNITIFNMQKKVADV